MNKILCFLVFVSMSSQNFDNTSMLTGDDTKSWYLYASSGENSKRCKNVDEVSADNTYSFSSDGTFLFDHGSVTGDTDCDDCCSDFVNVVGEWKFTNGGRGLHVTLAHEKGNANNARAMVLFDAAIEKLSGDLLILRETDKASGNVNRIEFRNR